MAVAAEIIETPVPPIRRFGLADLTEHGVWIMNRMLKIFPNHNERSIIGWLNGVLDQNDYLCLIMPHAVCFAERITPDQLVHKMVVREVFVWCQDPQNAKQQADAAHFYNHMAQWARFQGIDKVIVGERSDVPLTKIREMFDGRLHEFKTVFARL